MTTRDELLERGARLNTHVESVFMFCPRCNAHRYRILYVLPDGPMMREYNVCPDCNTAKEDLPEYG